MWEPVVSSDLRGRVMGGERGRGEGDVRSRKMCCLAGSEATSLFEYEQAAGLEEVRRTG